MKPIIIFCFFMFILTIPGNAQVSFENEVQPIFTASCAFSGCHADPNPPEGMNLEPGQAYNNIVNVPSSQQPSLDRVEPGDPSQSYLYLKITGDPSISGAQMPFGAPPLDSSSIATIEQWIQEGALTSLDRTSQVMAKSYDLYQNYPNPFNPETQIRFYLPVNGEIEVAVYDLLGNEVDVLVDGRRRAGEHSVSWDGTDHSGRNVTSGIYFYRLRTGNGTFSKKMILTR